MHRGRQSWQASTRGTGSGCSRWTKLITASPTSVPLLADRRQWLAIGVKSLPLAERVTDRVMCPQDVAWHCKHEHLFGSVGDDKQLIIWDTRKAPAASAGLPPSSPDVISFGPVPMCSVQAQQRRSQPSSLC